MLKAPWNLQRNISQKNNCDLTKLFTISVQFKADD